MTVQPISCDTERIGELELFFSCSFLVSFRHIGQNVVVKKQSNLLHKWTILYVGGTVDLGITQESRMRSMIQVLEILSMCIMIPPRIMSIW